MAAMELQNGQGCLIGCVCELIPSPMSGNIPYSFGVKPTGKDSPNPSPRFSDAPVKWFLDPSTPPAAFEHLF